MRRTRPARSSGSTIRATDSSSGRLIDGTIGAWRDDALAILQERAGASWSSSAPAWAHGSCSSRRSRYRSGSTRWWASPRRPTSPRTSSGRGSTTSGAPPSGGTASSTSPPATANPCPSAGAWWRMAGTISFSARPLLAPPGPPAPRHTGSRRAVGDLRASCRGDPGSRRHPDAGKGRRASPVGASRARAARRRRREPPLTVKQETPRLGLPRSPGRAFVSKQLSSARTSSTTPQPSQTMQASRPLQNRVTPFGDSSRRPRAARSRGIGAACTIPAGASCDGRRGYRAWVTCVLAFRGRHREVMTPNRYTELFFLDEATALAAGHRPCGECRRLDFQRFKTAWLVANSDRGLGPDVRIDAIDRELHRDRLEPGGRPRSYLAELDSLPDGVFVVRPDAARRCSSGEEPGPLVAGRIRRASASPRGGAGDGADAALDRGRHRSRVHAGRASDRGPSRPDGPIA